MATPLKSGYTYTAICFQAEHGAFADDAALEKNLRVKTGQDLSVKRENYDDGSWSTWFSVAPGATDAFELGRKLEQVAGVHSIMLHTDTNQIVPLHALPKLATGAIIDRKPPRI